MSNPGHNGSFLLVLHDLVQSEQKSIARQWYGEEYSASINIRPGLQLVRHLTVQTIKTGIEHLHDRLQGLVRLLKRSPAGQLARARWLADD